MSEHSSLAETRERIRERLTASPERGRRTAVRKVRLRQGLTCDVEEGPWKLVCDMDPSRRPGMTVTRPNLLQGAVAVHGFE